MRTDGFLSLLSLSSSSSSSFCYYYHYINPRSLHLPYDFMERNIGVTKCNYIFGLLKCTLHIQVLEKPRFMNEKSFPGLYSHYKMIKNYFSLSLVSQSFMLLNTFHHTNLPHPQQEPFELHTVSTMIYNFLKQETTIVLFFKWNHIPVHSNKSCKVWKHPDVRFLQRAVCSSCVAQQHTHVQYTILSYISLLISKYCTKRYYLLKR